LPNVVASTATPAAVSPIAATSRMAVRWIGVNFDSVIRESPLVNLRLMPI